MIADLNKISKIVFELRSAGNKIVFTNGVFDILHRGHVDYLKEAATFGDVLIVGVNSDNSVKRLKGDDRPINSEVDRAFLLSELRSVVHVIIFEDDTPIELIKSIKPDILVKGGDYDPCVTDITDAKYIMGSDVVTENGGEVKIVNLTPERSTTKIINKMRSNT
ncbi:MAG: D-glycero-beta-D-manno-heptose 1-phosphate adenylyltransferase [Candidatus Delongbacteria bacterium]|jgi:rfaE bifunctional protein nucleotidyltransferase chain/domain|nr:D-glycero-beta-D-manno-heptose 1-phosphate adenylyltransferase [Candidatus Delongbacteria bacterium]